MMQKMNELLQNTRRQGAARIAWTRAWISPVDRVLGQCARGHAQLKGWANCPYCQVELGLASVKPLENSGDVRWMLVRTDQVTNPIALREGTSWVGNTPDCDSWIENVVNKPVGPLKCDVQHEAMCTAEKGSVLEVNGVRVSGSHLYDGDELKVDGVPLLVISVPESVPGPEVRS